jgi:uncharacterized protein (TIGR03083 family)
MIDYLAHVERDAARIAAMGRLGMEAAVPSCPGWTVADLIAHTGVVYAHKATIVGDGWIDEEPAPVDPPDADILGWFELQAAEMLAVLAAANPKAPAATWHGPDQTVGFWRRRMAHESVIHRLDAELAHAAVTPIDAALAADGIDEILLIMMTGAPDWSDTKSTDAVIAITERDGGKTWRLRAGEFTGTSPRGHRYVSEPTFFVDTSDDQVAASLEGEAGHLDAWLWGRGDLSALTVAGDPSLVARVRAVAADSTQ